MMGWKSASLTGTGCLLLAAFPATLSSSVPDLQGHRGSGRNIQENTWPGFESALSAGMSSIEADLHLTRDNQLVILHGPTIKSRDRRKCVHTEDNGLVKRNIGQLSLAEIRSFVCFKTDKARKIFRFQPPILTLNELLLHLSRYARKGNNRRPGLFLDVKYLGGSRETNRSLAERIMRELALHSLTDKTTIQSYNPGFIREVRRLYPRARIVMLYLPAKSRARFIWSGRRRQLEEKFLRQVLSTGADGISVHRYYISRELVEAFHRHKLLVYVFTVNTKRNILRFLEMGVDGISTDKPELLYRTVNSRG